MDYKVQLVINNGWRVDRDVVCTCGHHRKVEYNGVVGACPVCEVSRTKSVTPYYGEVKYRDNVYESIEKTDQGFHIKRQEFLVTMNMEQKVINALPKDEGELSFSMKDKKIQLSRNGKKLTPTDACINTFFKGASKQRVLQAIATERNKNLFEFCYDELGKMGYERNNMWGRGLTRLKEYPAVEVFGLSLLSNNLKSLWNDFRSTLRSKDVAAPHKMLGVHKFMIAYIGRFRWYGSYQHNRLKQLCQHFDGNSVKMIMEIFDDESSIDYVDDVAETLIELHRDYGYKNLKRTVLYITREVKLEQGIVKPDEAITLLRDYARMSQAMEIEHDNYPKSLKKDHDIALANYKTRESDIKQKEFAQVIEYNDYADLDFKGKPYSIVRPTHVRDVINEGESLSHCVASYVDDIIKRKCKIVFLRDNQAIDESLVTVEVRGTVVRQVRGRFNRKPSDEEQAFVNLWAKKKFLAVQNY